MVGICSTDGCDRPAYGRGMCRPCYGRAWRSEQGPCAIAGCPNRAAGRGWCATHYSRWRKSGDPLVKTLAVRPTDEERFWRYVKPAAGDGCWLWSGGVNSNGYGQLNVAIGDGRYTTVRAHRLAYELLVAPIPDGLEIDHLCRNRRCVNPEHLEPVTRQENLRRALVAWRAVDSDETREIRALRDRGVPVAEIAARFDLSKVSVWRICNGQQRADVA